MHHLVLFFPGALVHHRWKNVMTYFAIELREQKSASSASKIQIYDQLWFLLPTVQVRETSGNAEPIISDEEHQRFQSPPLVPSPHIFSDPNGNKKSYGESLLDIVWENKETTSHMDDPETHLAFSCIYAEGPTHPPKDRLTNSDSSGTKIFSYQCPPRDT